MRITNNMMVNNLLANVNKNLLNMSKMQDQLASGKKVQTASDDPVAASKIIQYKTEIAQNEQYSKNASDALSWMEGTESALSDINKVLQRARELSVRAATGTNTPEDVKKIGDEFKELRKQLIMDANTSFAGRYMFSGYHTEEKLLDDDGNYVIGQTDEDINNPPVSRYQIGVGEDIKISTNGLDVYGTVLDSGNFATKMPSTSSNNGVASTQSEFKGEFNLKGDYSGGTGNMDITIGSNVYTVDKSKLNLSDTDLDNPESVANAKNRIVNELKSAIKSIPASPEGVLSDDAEVYFNDSNELVIKAKEHGNINISQTGPSLGLVNAAGTDVTEASVDSGAIADGDVGTNFDNKEMVITLNGESKRVTIGTVSPQTVAGLVSATQTAIDANFTPSGKIIVSASAGGINFATAGTEDGIKPELKIMSVKSTKSQLIADFDEVIAAIDASDTTKTDDFLGKLDGHLTKILTNLSDVGARNNRLELITSRINENNITYTKLLSGAQDADMSEVIMKLKNSENVYRASLSTGAKVIQPSLMDFLR